MESDEIVFENVYYIYPNGVEALKGVNLTIRRGERVAIMGSNGAGKTTLIKHLNGLLKPSSGRVLVFGVDTRSCSVAELSKTVGIVFQNPAHMFFSETVREEVAFALRNFNYPEEAVEKRVESTLQMFGLEEYADRNPYTLSGGEMKRLSIACIIAYDPEVIVFDEPTVGQDRIQKENLSEIFKLLELQGKTVIVVTHDIEFVAENFKRVVILHEGRVVKDGLASDVLYDEASLLKCNLTMPVIAKLASKAGLNSRFKPLNVYDMLYCLEKLMGGLN